MAADDNKRIYAVPNPPLNYLIIVYQDVFHLKSLYILMNEHVEHNGWYSYQGPWEEGETNAKYETTIYDNRDPGNKKLWVWWRLQKPVSNKYYHYFMNINFMFLGWKNVEVMHKGTKYKGQTGELSIFIRPWIRFDYQDKWDNHPVLKHVHPFFIKRVFKEDMLAREEELLMDAYRLHAVVKKFLEQKSFIPDRDILYEPRRKFG
ncbi:MAG: hypothetical protein MAG795_00661 [Candidatus Woesearchaeota archaeon]|nr:hypothetical protein [Candidatus Woesearchaeota archaeon]